MNLDIPESVILPDGTTGQVKAVAARVIDGRLDQVTYSIEKRDGAWTDVAREDVRPQLGSSRAELLQSSSQ